MSLLLRELLVLEHAHVKVLKHVVEVLLNVKSLEYLDLFKILVPLLLPTNMSENFCCLLFKEVCEQDHVLNFVLGSIVPLVGVRALQHYVSCVNASPGELRYEGVVFRGIQGLSSLLD